MVIAPVATIDAAVRTAQASVIREGISVAIPANMEPLGHRMDRQALVTTGRMNVTDKALQAVLARASATDRLLAALQAGLEEERRLREEDKVRHNQEMEEEKKRISDSMTSAALVQGNILAEILAHMKEQREETREIKSRLPGILGPQSTPMVFSPAAPTRSVFNPPGTTSTLPSLYSKSEEYPPLPSGPAATFSTHFMP